MTPEQPERAEAPKIISPDSKLNLSRGIFRLWNNQCPRCNSDAPGVDNCWVCGKAHMDDGRISSNIRGTAPYPPNLGTKGLWFYTWVHPFRDAIQRAKNEDSRKEAAND